MSEEMKRIDELEATLSVLLHCVDYLNGACRVNEPVGGVLPKEIILKARKALGLKDSSNA